MCGIAGLLLDPKARAVADPSVLQTMTDALIHRGPDAEGHWRDDAAGVALGHRRLSILDLSAAGAQPMQSVCGRYATVFNGEIYNHLALRRSLEVAGAAPAWRGHSDTETLLALIVHKGLEPALRAARGMFALALWDRQRQCMSLARDRMGEKPLYAARTESGWVFGSELGALCAGGVPARVDPVALAAYLQRGHVPDHMCILRDTRKVMPGSILELRLNAAPQVHRFAEPEALFGTPATITDPDAAQKALEEVLQEVVQDQMLSDVPLGCFLSGGVDSSLVASLMQAGSDRQIHSFSIGFEEARFNEAPHAAAVAAHLGTAHTEFTLREEDALALVPDLASIYDEPFADSSQLPTTLLCRAARAHVTVALTGDGGDEIFGGYNRHVHGPRLWSRVARLPRTLRPALAATVAGVSWLGMRHEEATRRAFAALGLPLTTLDNLPKLATVLRDAQNPEAFYQTFISTGLDSEKILAGAVPNIPPDPRARHPGDLPMADWIMSCDMTGYLPGDILVKVDRAAMSVGLETRAPFLDARVIEVARRIQGVHHVDSQTGKKQLRALLDRHVPRSLTARPKQGFAMPLDAWLRGALHEWAAALIADESTSAALGLDGKRLQEIWNQHIRGKINAGRPLWTILMLLLWAKRMGIVRV